MVRGVEIPEVFQLVVTRLSTFIVSTNMVFPPLILGDHFRPNNPDFVLAFNNRGLAYSRMGEPDLTDISQIKLVAA